MMTPPCSRRFVLLAALVLAIALPPLASPASPQAGDTGILVLAHGGRPEWNARVNALVQEIDALQPTDVAFGMATRANIQAAVDRLAARGVSRIVAVPLFVSSHSSVVTSTAYLLGLRADMPKDLAMFARMSHGPHGHGSPPPAPPPHGTHGSRGSHRAHAAHGSATASPVAATDQDGTRPIVSRVPVTMTAALDAHPLVSDIVQDRAAAISRDPSGETVILVAHGPVADDDNERWLANMAVIGAQVQKSAPFAAVEYLTVRDDAPAPVRDAAAEELRALVRTHAGLGRRVLVVPLLLSFGGIEQGLRTRLEGLSYTMADKGLMPDPRITAWVRAMAATP